MSLLEWFDFYESGNPLIDSQHKQLLKMINNYKISCQFNMKEKAIREFIEFLKHYVEYHFQAEEAFQKTSMYPDFRKHQAAHDMICIQLKNLCLKLETKDYSNEFQNEFELFFINSVNKHLYEEDIPFCIFYKNYTEATAV
ncbi:hemerythrin domain-containing protein [Paludicola sp. MB14-C6]|uniref:bacteriohemerythrin n=1 Tax=Paludihabitans sp. MB14-C6 TaxID=3070656 RepID=UPI0027DCB62B|nr:hemerythrin domain-containing protein [Paludicola sp. MB14-C6]WMJ22542.1 hemerythrin domain-containing protein [Paludicola sp. MB14-C6]